MGSMDFGDCQDCGEYKFLEEDYTCPTCLTDDDEEWVVMVYVPHMGGAPDIYERDLSEEEAKEIAKEDAWLTAKPSHLL